MFSSSRLTSRLTPRLAVVLVGGLVVSVLGPVTSVPAAGSVARVASSSSGSSSARKSITLKRPAGTAAGQVMLAAIVSNDDEPRFSAPVGWAVVRDDSIPDRLRQSVYVKVAGPAEPSSYTWKLSEWRRVAGGVTTYAGVDTARPVDAHGAAANPVNGTAVTAPAVATSAPDALLVHFAAVSAEGSLKAPPGMTRRWKAASRHRKKPGDVLVGSSDGPWGIPGDTGLRTATATKPGPAIGALLALRPAPPPPPPPAPQPPSPPPPLDGDPVLVGAGDIADCRDPAGARATGDVLDGIPGTVFTLGDNVYVDGTPKEFTDCYEPAWGRHKARTAIAVAGNHDYNTPGAAGHYGYFGAAAGDPARGYFDTRLGAWHVIVLNSNCEEVGGCGAGSPQEQWLRRVLAASSAQCTVALWHHPAFSSATVHRAFPTYQPFWQALYDHGADVVLSASDHVYERFGFQDPAGDADAVFGLRQFTVGTGGRSHQSFKTPVPNSEVRHGATYGVLKLTLHADSYDWRFVPEAGKTFTDSGTSACHGAPPPPPAEPGPIRRVGSSSNATTSGTSLDLARPVGTAPGHVMVAAVVTSDDDPPLSAPAGWVKVRSDAVPDSVRQTVYVKVAGDTEPSSYIWTLTARQQLAGGITAYSGVDTARPVDAAAATVAAGAGTDVTAPAILTTVPDTKLIHFTAVNAEGTVVAPPGMTQRWLAAAPVGSTGDALAASFDATHSAASDTGPRTARTTEPGARIAALLALRPAP